MTADRDAAPAADLADWPQVGGPDDGIDYDAAEAAFEAWKPRRSGSSLRSFNAGARWAYHRYARPAPAAAAGAGEYSKEFDDWWESVGVNLAVLTKYGALSIRECARTTWLNAAAREAARGDGEAR